ncbi:type II secretion system F family protein [Candidatus Saccharibacteria bacterium]|nr:type II secretion system F family protein [Candidatus Saccharibacteria bacterium]
MAQFSYTALGVSGQPNNGTITAPSRAAAIQTLNQQNIKPINVKEVSSKKSHSGFGSRKVKARDLVIFTRQLSTMINAGIPLTRSISVLQAQTSSKKLKEQLSTVVKDIESGVNLADSLEKHPSTFSPIYVNMIRAGETGGILDDILKKLAQQQEKDAAIRAKIKSATTYPLVLLVITVMAFFVLTIFVVPKIGTLVTSLGGPDAKLPPQTAAMLALSSFIRTKWFIVAGIFIGGPIIFNRWRKTTKGKQRFDAFLLKVPVIKTVVTKVAIARFARIFASLMAAGVPVLQSLEVTAKSLGNYVIQTELLDASNEVKNGKQLSAQLSKSQVFPPIVSQMLAVGEETGQTATTLVKVADFYEEEVDALVNGLSSILEPVMIVVMGSMVGLIAASVIGPISGLANNIQ